MGGTDQRHANRRTRGEPHRPTHTTHSTPQNVPWLKKGYERRYERSLTAGSIGYNTVGESSGRGGDRNEGMMMTGRSAALPPVLLLRARPDGASEAATNRPRDDVGGSLRGLWVCRCRACGVRRGMKKKEEEKEEPGGSPSNVWWSASQSNQRPPPPPPTPAARLEHCAYAGVYGGRVWWWWACEKKDRRTGYAAGC